MSTDTAAPTRPISRPAVFLQDACYHHRYIRSQDLSNIVERPERLRAIKIGLSAAIARLGSSSIMDRRTEPSASPSLAAGKVEKAENPNDLATALSQMNIAYDPPRPDGPLPITIVRSAASVDLLHDPAVKYVHGGNKYLENLTLWAENSWKMVRDEGSEIPKGLSQGDLYLCPESILAMEGAVGTVCEAVDKVIASSKETVAAKVQSETHNSDPPISRAFVAIRPPGHHCGSDSPSGFCFVNNVAIGAAHAHIRHGIKRVVILDIDLHHGNGTQSIAWEINEGYGQEIDIDVGLPESAKSDLRVYYGSVHDILSYPCEDGKMEFVQAASVSLHQAHGQYIENVHLQTYLSEQHFWDELYKERYSKILRKAEDFLNDTGGPGDDVLVFISCGMDACEHEYESMSRHNRKVPTSFYFRFTRDACNLSDRYARGRIVSVLEGGYSDRALMSGTMAHVCGLAHDVLSVDEEWWNLENLLKIEKATKKRRGGRTSLGTSEAPPAWVNRTIELFQTLEENVKSPASPLSTRSLRPPSSMKLRERSTRSAGPIPSQTIQRTASINQTQAERKNEISKESSVPVNRDNDTKDEAELPKVPKPLPRVILRLGPDPSVTSAPVDPSSETR